MIRQQAKKLVIRSIATLLTIGGVVGIVLVLLMEASAEGFSHPIFLVFAMLLFGACTWVGVGLCKSEQRYHGWAMLLFLLQVPVIEVHRVAYHFYVGSGLFLTFQNEFSSRLAFEFELASALKFAIPSGTENIVIGVNVLALAVAVYLMETSTRLRKPSEASVLEHASQSTQHLSQ